MLAIFIVAKHNYLFFVCTAELISTFRLGEILFPSFSTDILKQKFNQTIDKMAVW